MTGHLKGGTHDHYENIAVRANCHCTQLFPMQHHNQTTDLRGPFENGNYMNGRHKTGHIYHSHERSGTYTPLYFTIDRPFEGIMQSWRSGHQNRNTTMK